MKLKVTLLVVIAALLWIAMSMCSPGTNSPDASETSNAAPSKNTGIKWLGYDEGMAAGKENGKKILIYFFADWCHYCKKMDKNTFSDSKVIAFMNENFVSIRLNSDVEKQIAREYKVSGLPATCLMDKDGGVILLQPGYIPGETFLPFLKYIQSDSYRSKTFKDYMEAG